MARLPHNQTYVRQFLMVQTADHISGLTGASPTVRIAKGSGSFVAPVNAPVEIANGIYYINFSTTDTNTLGDLAVHITAASGDPTDFVDQVVAGFFKNIPYSNFMFLMTDSTNHAPATGKTVTVTRALDGAAFAAGTLSAVTEVGNGIYSVNFLSADLNANTIILRATATGCDDTLERITPQN